MSPTVLPYHFVPVEAGGDPGDVAVSDFDAGRVERLGHHRFVAGCHSGRILCRLTTESPIFVGAERRPGATREHPAEVDPFEIDGEPAIPGSSLRGMVSAIAEAAASSALRVLDDRVFSFRAAMRGSLSAVGEVIVEHAGTDPPRYFLRPIALPTLRLNQGWASLPRELHGWFDTPRLKVYVGETDSRGKKLESYRADRPRYYGLQLGRARRWDPSSRLREDRDLHVRRDFLLAQRVVAGGSWKPVPWESIPEGDRHLYTQGIVRVMTSDERRKDLASTGRRHELFLPFEPKAAARWPRFPILPEAVERFHELAAERTEAHRPGSGPLLPYEPVGTERNENSKKDGLTFRLKTGDLVYFRPTADGKAVEEIALSSIWRQRVEDHRERKVYRAWSFFEAVDPELVPFHEGRTKVTLAEQLFGFAAEGDPKDITRRLPALRSRARFANARLEPVTGPAPRLGPCVLKILDSPKPPSPSLYFHDGRDGAIEKTELRPGAHRPHGRKHYVHQRYSAEARPQHAPWRTAGEGERTTMKSQVSPLRAGLSFTFHVDFDNLTDRELGALLYALRPTEAFRHKLGMGKPIGLGTVRLDVLGVFEVDRQQRYRAQGLFAPRYHAAWIDPAAPGGWPEGYEAESRTATSGTAGSLDVSTLRAEFRDSLRGNVRNALERLGETIFEPSEVSGPLVEGGSREKETFEWFVSNANLPPDQRKTLRPIQERGWPRLPTLRPHPRHR